MHARARAYVQYGYVCVANDVLVGDISQITKYFVTGWQHVRIVIKSNVFLSPGN